MLQDKEEDGERNRTLYILKSRGMPHSNQIREFCLSNKGILLHDVYVGAGGVLTGSARISQEIKDKADSLANSREIERKQREMKRKKMVFEARNAALRARFEAENDELEQLIAEDKQRQQDLVEETENLARKRQADSLPQP